MTDGKTAHLLEELRSAMARGRTLPARWYTDPDVLRLETERVFRRRWQPLAESAALGEAGDFLTSVVGGVPIVVVRGNDGAVRGFVNVCRHRAHLVAQGCGRATTLQCPYHAWTYGLDGALRAAPRSDREPAFDKSALSLVSVQVAEWGSLVFVNLDPSAPPFEELFGELRALGGERGATFDGMTERAVEDRVFECNWKVFYENSAECYHCPTVHPQFAREHGVGPTDYQLEIHDSFVYHCSPVREAASGGVDWEMYAAWPNWGLATGGAPGILYLLVYTPVDPGRTRVLARIYATPEVSDAAIDEERAWWRHVVLQEDRQACESVQLGLASGQVEDGPLLLDSEHVIRGFQEKLYEALSGTAPVPA